MNDPTDTIALATDLTVAWLSNANTRVEADAVPAFLATMHSTLAKLGTATTDQEDAAPEFKGAVTVRKSLADPNFIISMIDGKPYKSLKRHLTRHGLSPAEYRERYGLKPDYPTTAPAYSLARSETAKRIGLGRKPGSKAGEQGQPAAKSRKGKSVAAAKAAAKAHLGGDAE